MTELYHCRHLSQPLPGTRAPQTPKEEEEEDEAASLMTKSKTTKKN